MMNCATLIIRHACRPEPGPSPLPLPRGFPGPAEHGRGVLRFVRLRTGLIGRSMGLVQLGLRAIQPVAEHIGGSARSARLAGKCGGRNTRC
jgi:hypothetical protein